MIGPFASAVAQTYVALKADPPPHWMCPNEDCMGNPTPAHWRQFLTCSDGEVVHGCGATPEEATERATLRREKYEGDLCLTPEARLKLLAAGDLGDTDQRKAIRLLIDLVIQIRART